MTRTLIVRSSARYDIRDFADAYEAKSPGLGTRFAETATRTIDAIPFMPFLHAQWKRRVRQAPIRKFPFAILYRVSRTQIEIFAVIPTKSNPLNWPVR